MAENTVSRPADAASQAAEDELSRRAPGRGVARLAAILARLRAPDGCPWDREQTLRTLKAPLLEETYELLEVMEGADLAAHAEELGDVLLQVLFQCQLRAEEGRFNLDEVAHGVADKLIRRHPHVFGALKIAGTSDVLRNWEAIKREEKQGPVNAQGAPRSALDGVPAALPALSRAARLQNKASRAGFDWPDVAGVEAKLAEELGELAEARQTGDAEAVRHELGDLLFTVVNLCRFLTVDPEDALQAANARFARRFRAVEAAVAASGRTPRECDMRELDALWEAAKRRE